MNNNNSLNKILSKRKITKRVMQRKHSLVKLKRLLRRHQPLRNLNLLLNLPNLHLLSQLSKNRQLKKFKRTKKSSLQPKIPSKLKKRPKSNKTAQSSCARVMYAG